VNILNTGTKKITSNTKRLFFNLRFFTLNHPRRGVSDVIATVLLLGITVAGAAMISVYLQDSNIADVSSFTPDIGTLGSSVSAIKLLSYDSRDTPDEDLARIPGLRNFQDGVLCTVNCNPINLPTDAIAGTEFIVLTIKNIGLDFVTLRGMTINDESYDWDSFNSGTCLDLAAPGVSYPAAGKFSFVRPNTGTFCLVDWEQIPSNVIFSGAEATLVVKLSNTLNAPSDLAYNSPLRIKMDTEKVDLEVFLIIVGSIK